MKAYIKYKKWWIAHHAPSLVPSLYWGLTTEEAFERHISNLSLFRLMETLVDWDE